MGELHCVVLQELFLHCSRVRPGREPLRVWPKVVTFLASVPPFAYVGMPMSACPPSRRECAPCPTRELLARLHGPTYETSRPGHLCRGRAGAGPVRGLFGVWGGRTPGHRVARPC